MNGGVAFQQGFDRPGQQHRCDRIDAELLHQRRSSDLAESFFGPQSGAMQPATGVDHQAQGQVKALQGSAQAVEVGVILQIERQGLMRWSLPPCRHHGEAGTPQPYGRRQG